jgi:hypothetical protein
MNTNPPTYDQRAGRLVWDNDDQTLAIMVADGGLEPVTLQTGQEQQFIIRNNTGSPIANGAAGFANGSISDRVTVALAQADDILTAGAQGLATQTIGTNDTGFVALFGIVRGLDTQTPGWNEGDLLYVSPTVAGGLQNTPPTSGFNVVVGRVLRKHPSTGIVAVNPRPLPAFGNIAGGNYTQFEYDGTMKFVGDATTWRDELGPLLASRLESPASDIVQNITEGSITFKSSARYPTDYVVYNVQVNHDWLIDSDVEFHIHLWQTQSEPGNFLLGYRWQANGQAKTTAWTEVALTNQIFTYSAGTLNQILDVASAITPPASADLSDVVQFRLYRDYTNASGEFSGAETNGIDIDVMSSDMHRQSDTIGSRLEYTK